MSRPDGIGRGVAEGPLRGGVEVDDAALVVHRHHAVERGVEHRAVARLLRAQGLGVAAALDRLADLIAERRHRREQLGVELARLAGEELDHAEHAARAADREAERGVQARARRAARAREVVVRRRRRRSRRARRSARPDPGAPPRRRSVIARLAASNSSASVPAACQVSTHASASGRSAAGSQTAPSRQPRLSPIARSAPASASRGSAVCARLRATACSVRGREAIASRIISRPRQRRQRFYTSSAEIASPDSAALGTNPRAPQRATPSPKSAGVAGGGEHHRRRVRLAGKLLRHGQPAHVGQPDVEQHHARPVPPGRLERRGSVRGLRHHLVPVCLQPPARALAKARVVIDDEHRHRHARILAHRTLRPRCG